MTKTPDMKTSNSILFVEDDMDDREFFLETIQKIDPSMEVVLMENGVEAMQYLGQVQEEAARMPGLIVLDLNMPYLDGRQTFQRIRSEARLANIPVIIFTSSLNPNDKAFFNDQGVEFISKPFDFKYMNSIVSHMLSVCGNGKA